MKKVYIIAVIAALLAGIATFFFASDIKNTLTYADANKIGVVMAVADIPADSVIQKDMLSIKNLPADSVSAGAATRIDDLVGKIAADNIYQGEQIVAGNAVTLGDEQASGAKMSYKLKSGEYAFNIATDRQQSVGYAIQVGDFVNILYYYTDPDTKSIEAKRLYEKVKVIQIGDPSEIAAAGSTGLKTYSSVTVIVSRDQSLELAKSLKKGSLGLELFSYADAASGARSVNADISDN